MAMSWYLCISVSENGSYQTFLKRLFSKFGFTVNSRKGYSFKSFVCMGGKGGIQRHKSVYQLDHGLVGLRQKASIPGRGKSLFSSVCRLSLRLTVPTRLSKHAQTQTQTHMHARMHTHTHTHTRTHTYICILMRMCLCIRHAVYPKFSQTDGRITKPWKMQDIQS